MDKQHSTAGRYAIKGAIIGAAIAGGLALLTLNPFTVISAGVFWGIVGAGVGGLIGAYKEKGHSSPVPNGYAPQPPIMHGPTPDLTQEQSPAVDTSRTYQDMVTTSRIPGPPERGA